MSVVGIKVIHDTPYKTRINKVEAIHKVCTKNNVELPSLLVVFSQKKKKTATDVKNALGQ